MLFHFSTVTFPEGSCFFPFLFHSTLPHWITGTSSGFCAAQRLHSLRWEKFTLWQAGHRQFPFSPSDPISIDLHRYPKMKNPTDGGPTSLDWWNNRNRKPWMFPSNLGRSCMILSEKTNALITNRSWPFFKEHPTSPPPKRKTDHSILIPIAEISACYRSLPFVAWEGGSAADGFIERFWFNWNSQTWISWKAMWDSQAPI